MSNTLHLPSCSYAVLRKIIIAYSRAGENTSLDDISKLAVMSSSEISRNNKFLGAMGIISDGSKKTATPLGTKLGRALEYSQESEIVNSWQEVISSCEVVANFVTSVRIENEISRDALAKHILYTSGQSNTKGHKTGAQAIIDILLVAGHLIEEEGGQLKVRTSSEENRDEPTLTAEEEGPNESETDVAPESKRDSTSKLKPNLTVGPTIAINIQLHLPDTQNPEVYENLFSSLRKHLIDSDE